MQCKNLIGLLFEGLLDPNATVDRAVFCWIENEARDENLDDHFGRVENEDC